MPKFYTGERVEVIHSSDPSIIGAKGIVHDYHDRHDFCEEDDHGKQYLIVFEIPCSDPYRSLNISKMLWVREDFLVSLSDRTEIEVEPLKFCRGDRVKVLRDYSDLLHSCKEGETGIIYFYSEYNYYRGTYFYHVQFTDPNNYHSMSVPEGCLVLESE